MRRAIPWIGIIVLTFIVYAQSLGNGFVTWDDGMLILENPIIRGFTLHNISLAFTSYDPELYIPLTFLSYQMNYVVGALEPFGYHLGNLVLHIANVGFVYAIIRRLSEAASASCSGRSRSYATTGAQVARGVAVHPIHTQAVVWAAARKDVLSAFFLLFTVWLYLGSKESKKKYWLSVAVFALALLSKVSVITWSLVLPLMDWYLDGDDALLLHPRRGAAGTWKRVAPFAILSFIFGIIALGGKVANTGFLYEKILIGFRAITLLLQKFFWPVHLSPLYPFTKPIAVSTPEIGLSVLFVFLVSALVLWLAWKKSMRLPLFAWAWFLLLLAPSMSNILKGHNELLDVYVTSDRYAYLPSVGVLLVAGWLVTKAAERFPKIAYSSVFFVLFVFSILSYRQSLVWKNTLTLFTHVAQVQPQSYVAWSNIGTEETRLGNLNRGLQAYTKALAIRDDATTWYNVGQILLAQGKIDLAIEAYRKAIESSSLETDAKKALDELRSP